MNKSSLNHRKQMEEEITQLNPEFSKLKMESQGLELQKEASKLQNPSHKNTKVYFVAVAFSFIVGFSFLGVKAGIATATTLQILVHRFNFAFLAVILPILLGKVKILIKGKPKKILLSTSGFYIGFMALQAVGLKYATSVEGGIIFAIIPILTKIIAGFYLKETTSWKQNIFVCLSVASVIAMFAFAVTDINVNIMGIFILFLASCSMAISNVITRGVRKIYSPIEIAFSIVFLGFIVFNGAYLIFAVKTGTLSQYFLPLTNLKFLIAILYLGTLSTLISSLMMSYMLSHMEAVKATIFGNLSTAISIVAGVVIMKETLAWYHIVCTALIIIGVVGVSLVPSPQKKI